MRFIFIAWLPKAWKTTLSDYLWEKFTDAKVVHLDQEYLEFVEKHRKYMYWPNIHDCIQRHYENVSDAVKKQFYEFLSHRLDQINGETIIVEWRHNESLMYDLSKRYLDIARVDNIIIDEKRWVLVSKWQFLKRDEELWKNVFNLLNNM